MRFIILIFIGFLLTSCGNGGESNSAPAEQKPAKTAPEPQKTSKSPPPAKTAAVVTPMDRGAKLYKRCVTCHTLEDGGKHKVGPNLWGIYGSKAGSKEGFKYSKVMAASDIIWTDETIDGYIAKPAAFMKGNRMSFIGVKKAEDRDALQLYLKAKTSPAQ